MNSTIKFFAFGCWNLQGCTGNEYLRKNVENIKRGDYDFGIILGDNIYVPKKKKLGPASKEPYDIKTLIDGLRCINGVGKPLYIALGNHDVEQCDILLYQLYKEIGNIEPLDLQNWIIPANYYTIRKSQAGIAIKLIVIDTNLLTEIKQLNYDPNVCTVEENVQDNVEDMLQMVERELVDNNDDVDWIIIAGHLPLASIKDNNLTKSVIHLSLVYYERIYQAIYKSPYREKVIYICADTHNFQYNSLCYKEYTLTEFVLGTGGARPDIINNISSSTFPIFNGKDYTITLNQYYPSYGYGEFVVGRDQMNVTYVKAQLHS